MENLSKIANAIFSPKPELELTRISAQLLAGSNLALNPENSELCQNLVVGMYEGIQVKTNRVKFDNELIEGAFSEIMEMVSGAAFSQSDEAKQMMEDVLGKIKDAENGEGGANLTDVLSAMGITANTPVINIGTAEQQAATNPDGGKVVEMPNSNPLEVPNNAVEKTIETVQEIVPYATGESVEDPKAEAVEA